MFKTLALTFVIAAVVVASVPAQAALLGNGPRLNGTSLNGIMTGAALNGQIVGIELPAGAGETE